MKAAMYYGVKDVRIEDIPKPTIKPGEILLKVMAATTCGTDVKTYMRGHALDASGDFKPRTFGHECSGIVEEVGEGVTKFQIGDRVATHNTAPCGCCYYCKQDQPSLCKNLSFINGAFSEYIAIPARIVECNMFKMPDTMKFADASLMEPLACSVYGVDESNIQLGDTIVINGAGPIGLMMVRAAYLRGAEIIVCDMNEARLKLAQKLGAKHIIKVEEGLDQIKAVRNLTTDSRGVDVAIEAVGTPRTWEMTIEMARKGGTVMLFGGCKAGTQISIDTKLLHYSQLTIKGTFHTTPRHVEMAYEMIKRGEIVAEDFVNTSYSLDNIVEAITAHANQECIKSLITMEQKEEMING